MLESHASADPKWTTLTLSPDSISVQMAQQLLRSAGIESFVEQVDKKPETAFLSGMQQGYRVMVKPEDRDEAHKVLNSQMAPESDLDDEALSAPELKERDAGTRAAHRALQVAVLGFLLGPLLHPFSLIMALRTLRRKSLSSRSRRDAMVAGAISVFSLIFFAYMIHSILR
jgi:hypothetical protein